MVRCLLRHHCHLDQQDRHGNTPLHIACKDGNLPIVLVICNAKANLDLPNKVSASRNTKARIEQVDHMLKSEKTLNPSVPHFTALINPSKI